MSGLATTASLLLFKFYLLLYIIMFDIYNFFVSKFGRWFQDCIETSDDDESFQIISLEGNIGSGKSTILKNLQKNL